MGLVARAGKYNSDFTLEFNKQFNENLWDNYPLWWLKLILQALATLLAEVEKKGKLDLEKILKRMAGFFHTGGAAKAKAVANLEDTLEELSNLSGKLLDHVHIGKIENRQDLKIAAAAKNKPLTKEDAVQALKGLFRDEQYDAVHGFFREVLGKNLKLKVPADDLEKIKTLNEFLMKRSRPFCRKIQYNPDWFGERAYINQAVDNDRGFQLEENCPGPYYFAPQREKLDNVNLVSNHCIAPEMRLTAMTVWLNFLGGNDWNDFQWRYDELNNQILAAVDNAQNAVNPQKIDETIAWKLINFLSPEPGYKFPHYYNKNPQKPWKEIPIEGSVSLFDLETKTAKTKFGYYGDRPITITLPNYLQ
jgi:hypothetical protein